MADQTEHPALARILRNQRCADAIELIGHEMAGSDVTTLLLAAMANRAAARSPSDVMRTYRRDRFVAPSALDPVILARLRLDALQTMQEQFETVELAPLAPLGAHSTFSRVSQNNVVSTNRMSEVAADPTNQLALEAAVRRQNQLAINPRSDELVKLCGVERVVRAQRFSGPRSFAHFTLLGAVVAGRKRATNQFELLALIELLDSFARFIHQATSRPVICTLTDHHNPSSPLVSQIADGVADRGIAGVSCVIDPDRSSGCQYYQGVCFKLSVDGGGEVVELGDGGVVDWAEALLGNGKERLVIGGVSLDRLATLIRR